MMKINWLKKAWTGGVHNAFSDLCILNDTLYCCFREALNHFSPDGRIRILKLTLDGTVISHSSVMIAGTDLRDPKLTVTPDGKLLLIAYARIKNPDTRFRCRNLCWVSQDADSWSSAHAFATDFWWLWRVRWNQRQAYGFAYNRSAQSIDFYQGDPRRTFHCQARSVLGLDTHGKGYPNESDMVFVGQQAFALVRRDADSYTAQLGRSRFPYKRWGWQDLGFYLGGPVMQLLDTRTAIIAGRIEDRLTLRTAVLILDLDTGRVTEKLLLPSAGDNSYPGLVIYNQHLYVSYYSSHQDQKSQIYLAELALT